MAAGELVASKWREMEAKRSALENGRQRLKRDARKRGSGRIRNSASGFVSRRDMVMTRLRARRRSCRVAETSSGRLALVQMSRLNQRNIRDLVASTMGLGRGGR